MSTNINMKANQIAKKQHLMRLDTFQQTTHNFSIRIHVHTIHSIFATNVLSI